MAMWSMIFGAFTGGDEEDGGGIGEIVGGIFLIILAPIAAMIVQMAISRSREYSADAAGAQILGDPLPLASALEKLERWNAQRMAGGMVTEQPNPATSHLYIVNPLAGGTIANLFRTHPPTEERIARLRQLEPSGGLAAA
jgi:heat shock protein HtpX